MHFPELVVHDLGDGYTCLMVGWLAENQPYPTGKVSDEFFKRLEEHLEDPWQPFWFAGCHDCEFCVGTPYSASFNLFIPSGKMVYFAPSMILHYIETHSYSPPDEFVQALLASPLQNTPEFLEAVEPFAQRKRRLFGPS